MDSDPKYYQETYITSRDDGKRKVKTEINNERNKNGKNTKERPINVNETKCANQNPSCEIKPKRTNLNIGTENRTLTYH